MDLADSSGKVKSDIKDHVGIITLNDPSTLNAASLDLQADLQAALEAFIESDEVRSIVITAEGRGFCSGANLSSVQSRQRSPAKGPMRGLIKQYIPLLNTLRRSPKPVLSAVNGIAAGAGVSLALACDIVLAAESAYFLLAFRRIGMAPDGGTSWLLPRLVGKARAMELLLLGEKLPAKTAYEWGLINRCVADEALMPETLKIAGSLANGPESLGVTRNLVWRGLDAEWHAQIEDEAYAQGDAMRSADGQEGVRAFMEKRPPNFTGR